MQFGVSPYKSCHRLRPTDGAKIMAMKLIKISCLYVLLFACLLSMAVCQGELDLDRSSTDETPPDPMPGMNDGVALDSSYEITDRHKTILPSFSVLKETLLQKSVNSETITLTDGQMTKEKKHSSFDGDTDYQRITTLQNEHVGDGGHIVQESVQARSEKTEENQKQTVESSSDDDPIISHISNLTDEKSWLNWIRRIVDPVINEFKDDSSPLQNSTVSNHTTLNNSLPLSNSSSVELNSTDSEDLNNSTDWGKKKFHCIGRNINNSSTVHEVKIVNNTSLLQMLNFEKNDTGIENNTSDCILVLFFAPWCHFCAKTAPHYNALARAFPQLDVLAVDAAHFSNLNARFGTVSVPNILLFHQSRAVIRFNQTDRNFDTLVNFIKNATGLEPNTTVNVTEADYLGPLPSVPAEEFDYLLWFAWVFVVIFSSYMVIQSTRGQHWINRVRILWQEHQHID